MEDFAKYVIDDINGAISELIVAVGDNVDLGNQGKLLLVIKSMKQLLDLFYLSITCK